MIKLELSQRQTCCFSGRILALIQINISLQLEDILTSKQKKRCLSFKESFTFN